MTFQRPIVRSRLAALIACSLIATVVPISATAEYGIPAGSGAVITAGQPLTVRVAPGWDAEISYEIADGSYVTVWDVAQTAPDGSLWYPVDGGFVPADGVTSVATLEGGVALYQDAAPDASASEGWVDPNTGEWVEPAASEGWVDPATGQWVDGAASEGWVDPTTGEWVEPAPVDEVPAKTDEWVESTASEGWVDPNTGEWVEPAVATTTSEGWIDPNTGQWVEPTATEGWVDPNTGQWVSTAPSATTAQGWIDPATGQWIDATQATQPAATEGWVDSTTGQWVEAAQTAQPAATDGWVDPNTGQWVEAAPVVADAAPADQWVEPAPADTGWSGGSEPWGEPIAMAYISGTDGDGAACRTAPDIGTQELAVLGEGEAIEVRGEAVGEWQPVNCAGVGGYINTSLISWEPVAAENSVELEQKARRNKNRDDDGNAGANAGNDGTSSASGQQIVNFAMQYVGYPYAYAGEGPYAFDCSGFTKFVIQNTLGIDITHDMFTQIGMGQSVGMDQLQPGDLVFFQNTFRPGLSHVGIYTGGGQFVHAENESTGVQVSDLNSDYYGSRWAGGARIG